MSPEITRATAAARDRVEAGWPLLLLFVLTGAHLSSVQPLVRLVGILAGVWFLSRRVPTVRRPARTPQPKAQHRTPAPPTTPTAAKPSSRPGRATPARGQATRKRGGTQ